MIQAIVFSRNRAAQLDLLLRSIEARAPIFDPIQVIYRGEFEFAEGYQICKEQHPEVRFLPEKNLSGQVEGLLRDWSDTPCVTFLCDDDLIIRPFIDDPRPDTLLMPTPSLLCISLRLGFNTTHCYPYDRKQEHPGWEVALKDIRMWSWEGKDGDWGYPGSIDGHVFRRNDLLDLLINQPYGSAYHGFSNPNELEEVLNRNCRAIGTPLMACYSQSVLTGVPANRVNTSHPNRNGQEHPLDLISANAQYRAGKRLVLDELSAQQINAAHTELPLVFA